MATVLGGGLIAFAVSKTAFQNARFAPASGPAGIVPMNREFDVPIRLQQYWLVANARVKRANDADIVRSMPYTDLVDFRDANPSIWVDIHSPLLDPKRFHLKCRQLMDELECAVGCRFDAACVSEHHSNGYGLISSSNLNPIWCDAEQFTQQAMPKLKNVQARPPVAEIVGTRQRAGITAFLPKLAAE